MSDRSDLIELLEAVEKHEMRCENSPESADDEDLWDVARRLRSKLEAQEKAEAVEAAKHGEGPLAHSDLTENPGKTGKADD